MRKSSLAGRELELYDDIRSIRDRSLVERGKAFVSNEIIKLIEQRERELFGGIHAPDEKLRPYIEIAKKIIEDDYEGLPLPHYVNSKDDLKRDGKQAFGVYDVYTGDTHEYESGYAKHRIVNIYIPEKELIPELLGRNYPVLRKKSRIKGEDEFLDKYQKRVALHEYIEVAYRDINEIWNRKLTEKEHAEVELLVLDALRYLAQRGSEEAKEIYKIALEEHKIRDKNNDVLTKYMKRLSPSLNLQISM